MRHKIYKLRNNNQLLIHDDRCRESGKSYRPLAVHQKRQIIISYQNVGGREGRNLQNPVANHW